MYKVCIQIKPRDSSKERYKQITNMYIRQSYVNSFLGDVVPDTFNNVSKDEENILDQIYIKEICPDFYNNDL